MQQQLIEQTIQITPQTMNDVLPKLTHTLSQLSFSSGSHANSSANNNPSGSQHEEIIENIVKSIFYGLWNFDKMINQHNLSTALAQMLVKMPKKNAFAFLSAMLAYLSQKWNLIDHHRINKFMQLVKYLVKQAIKISHKKADEVLLATVFQDLGVRSGMVDHVIEIYFNIICDLYLNKLEGSQNYSDILPYQKLEIFQHLLNRQDSLQYTRLHIIQKIYEKYKRCVIQTALNLKHEDVLQKIDQFNAHILQLAKKQQNDKIRKNLYTLIGFMKSEHDLFQLYIQEKQQKQQAQKQKRLQKNKNKHKVISKEKRRQKKQIKNKRKIKNKKVSNSNKKKHKIISRPKFQHRARQNMQKIMDI